MEAEVWELMRAGITVDLIVGVTADDGVGVGVRLRTIGKRLPKQLMVLGCADTFEEALADAVAKAAAGRWESLNWAARPWETRTAPTFSQFGLPSNV